MRCDTANVGDTGPSPNLFDLSLAPLMAHGFTYTPVLDEPYINAPDIAHDPETEVVLVSLPTEPLERLHTNTPANQNLSERFPHHIRQATVKRYRWKRLNVKILKNHSAHVVGMAVLLTP
jgi:hypothetical protein